MKENKTAQKDKSDKKSNLQIPEDLIRDMNDHLPGDLTIKELQRLFYGKVFKVWFIRSEAMMNTPIDAVDLSVRASNTLKRAGFQTIGDLLDGITSFDDLKKSRGCGVTTLQEIKGKLFFYQYSRILPEKRYEYMNKILEINGIRTV